MDLHFKMPYRFILLTYLIFKVGAEKLTTVNFYSLFMGRFLQS